MREQRSKSTVPKDSHMAVFPWTKGMVLGSDRPVGKKVMTSLYGESPDLNGYWQQQSFDKSRKKMEQINWSLQADNKMIVNDLVTMKKGILEQIERKVNTREELLFHNGILKQTNLLKQEDESKHLKAPSFAPD